MAADNVADARDKFPQDLVAIFHASFHPTKGNVVDWSLKASDDLNLDQLEFSALPSGLHLVEKDVVYFTKESQHGVCIFKRRPTSEPGHRGVRLSSLGILLAKSRRPRPWRHINALKELIDTVYSMAFSRGGSLDMTEDDWEPAKSFFEERKLRRADLGGAGDWMGWSDELDGAYSAPVSSNPTIHLPHLLRVLGPSSLTLYKHVLGRKRILIYTLPPVEVACILCKVAGDLCFETQANCEASSSIGRLKGKHREPISSLGMITLADLDRLEEESKTGKGWIACTTDAIFMEKPAYYDLLIDLTTSTPNKATRPTFYSSKPLPSSQPTPQYRLSSIRFAWSDVKLWSEIDRILQLDSEAAHHTCCSSHPPSTPNKPANSITAWTDAWQVYEDVCIICAGLWMGTWRGNSAMSYSTAGGAENWGSVRLDGDDDLTLGGMSSPRVDERQKTPGKQTQLQPHRDSKLAYVRNVGMGIEGRPVEGSTLGLGATTKSARRASAMSWSSGKATVVGSMQGSGGGSNGKARQPSTSTSIAGPSSSAATDDQEADRDVIGLGAYHSEEEEAQRHAGQLMTTMAVLQTFHAHTAFQLSVLEDLLERQGLTGGEGSGEKVLLLTPKDILAFELGPLSGFDARYLEWLGAEYAGDGVRVVVKRGWKDLLGAFFGYG